MRPDERFSTCSACIAAIQKNATAQTPIDHDRHAHSRVYCDSCAEELDGEHRYCVDCQFQYDLEDDDDWEDDEEELEDDDSVDPLRDGEVADLFFALICRGVQPAEAMDLAEDLLDGGEGLADFDSYVRVGIPPAQVDLWLPVGPTEAGRWHKEGFGWETAIEWQGVRFGAAFDAMCRGLDPYEYSREAKILEDWSEWSVASLVDLEDRLRQAIPDWWDLNWDDRWDAPEPPAREWATDHGVELAEAFGWEFAHVKPGDHLRWVDLGFTPAQIATFRNNNELELAEEWARAGVDPEDILHASSEHTILEAVDLDELKRAGVPLTLDGIMRWGGLTAEQILDAADGGFENAAAYLPYAGSGLDSSEVDQLEVYRGLYPPEDAWQSKAVSWMKAGISAAEAATWIALGTRVEQAVAWRKAGFSAVDARPWYEVGVDPSAVSAWEEFDFSPSEARRWHLAGATPPHACQWRETALGPEEAAGWIVAGIDPQTAQRRASAGLVPPDPA